MPSPPGFSYLWYEELDEAKAQSRTKWIDKMGRAKLPQDLTEYIWPWFSPPDESYFLLQLTPDTFHLLAPPERNDLLPFDDPLVVACFQDGLPPRAPDSPG